jgi:hypothetical protein
MLLWVALKKANKIFDHPNGLFQSPYKFEKARFNFHPIS